MEDLKAMRNSVLREIELQEEKGKQRTPEVEVWLEKFVDMDRRANQLMIDFRRCCVTGCCSLNIHSRLNASRKATKLKKEIDELMKEKIHLGVLTKRRPSDPVIDMPISSTNVGIMNGSNLRVVRDCLADKTFGRIGIYGMGGIGKTTLLNEIKRSIDDWNMGFDYVIHARASYELHVEDLRDCIGEQLPLCEPSRETIFEFLKYKNFLLLLDDLWEELDITVLGIPDPHDEIDVTTLYKHKVVFTTRSKQVCDCMKADKKIKLDCLDKDEGWQLFKENLAKDFEGMPFIEEAAKEVANLCGGLPLALIMVGQAVSNMTSTAEWNCILNLQGGLFSSLCESMLSYLKGSYDILANKTLQQCFLCFCLWPKKKLISTEDLMKCWLGFGLISCFDSLSEAYMHGCYILEILEEASLVVTHDNKRVAKVHEVIHAMAQWIALGVGGGSHKPWFVKQKLQNIPLEQLSLEEVETWFQMERVSVVDCNMNCLPELQFECLSLLSLNIQHNKGLKNLPKIFFQQMPNLTYLNLSFTEICELPTVIMDLCNLEFLDISCTRIISLPNKLGNLKKLKYLFCRYLRLDKLQAEPLSSLHSLQVLDVYPYGYVEPKELGISRLRGLKGIGMRASSNYILEQLSSLPMININIDCIDGLPTLYFSSATSEEHGGLKELQIRFSIAIRELVLDNRSKTSLKFLKFLRLYHLLNLGSFNWMIEPKEVFPMLQLVEIEACSSLTSLHWVLHLPLLRALLLKDCYKMIELVNGEEGEIKEDDGITTFPRLKYLSLVRLRKLVKISSCALDFPRLSEVHLEDCPNLKRLPFKPDIVSNQGLLIKCDKKWWERLEWDDATVQSQFRSNSTEDEEIAEFFVGNVPTEDDEIVEFFVDNVPALGHKDPPTKSGLYEVHERENTVKTEHDGFKEKTEAQPPRAVMEIPTSVIPVSNMIKLNLEKVRGYLANDNVSMVGIWGMGGVGKTTLLNEINNSLKGGDTNMGFKYVIYLVVSKEPQFEQLQNQISSVLGLLANRCKKNDIFKFLMNKDFLLLLDDIWERVKLLEALGIPLPRRQSRNSKGSGQRYKHKVIFTTREKDVCAQMKPDQRIKVECLGKEEAWHLFKQNANERIIGSNVIIEKLAMEVMEKCSGLPLALKVVGKATSNKKTIEQWKHMLTSLNKLDNMEESLFHTLKLSYDNLADDTLRECFLCCAQWPEEKNIHASDLIEYWIGFGLIGDFENIGEAFNKGYSLIGKLNAACLLELKSYPFEDYVKLHHVIRDMALWIVSECGKKKNNWIVGTSDGDFSKFSKWAAGNWNEVERILFTGLSSRSPLALLNYQNSDEEEDEVSVAPTSPRYPNLKSVFIDTYPVERLPGRLNFRLHMPSLIYLNLSGNNIILDLTKEIRVLVNLRYLNISHTNIWSLPPELEELKQLKYFICRHSTLTSGLSVISRLPKLQVLDLYHTTCLEAQDLSLLKGRVKAIGMHVQPSILGLLKELPTWNISMAQIENMPILRFCDLSYKHGEGLMELNIRWCDFKELLINGSGVSLKKIKLEDLPKLKQITWPAETVPSECFQRLTYVDIYKCDFLRNLSWVLHLPCLRRLYVNHCSAMEELIETAEMQQALSGLATFPSLQSLSISYVENLVSLSTCPLDFPVLSSLWLCACPKLKKLPFKSSIVNNKFERLRVDGKEWWEHLEWEDTTIRDHFTKFLDLCIM